MFDIFISVDFKKCLRQMNCVQSFSEEKTYSEINFVELSVKLENVFITYLQRRHEKNCYLHREGKHFLLFGTIFTNRKYFEECGRPPSILNINGLTELFNIYGDNFIKYIKGFFVILLITEEPFQVQIITDRVNVIPLYYFFNDQLLIASSSVRMMMNPGIIPPEKDHTAFLELLLFDYMLYDHYFYKNIRQTLNASRYTFNETGCIISKYWTVEELYYPELLKRSASFRNLSDQLYKNINLYASDCDTPLVSLTGGFDSRTNVSMLTKAKKDFHCFSYGLPGSKQMKIPEEIAQKIDYQYTPVLLDSSFENDYYSNALLALDFSNGTAPFLRAIWPFVYKRLRKVSETIVTGHFGSEILSPIETGLIINDFVYTLFFNDTGKNSHKLFSEEIEKYRFVNIASPEEITELIIDYLEKNYFKKYSQYDKHIQFLFFVLEEGLRKFFMQEMQIERVFVNTRCPFIDDDFIDLVFHTPFAKTCASVNIKSKYSKVKNMLESKSFYAKIINDCMPGMGSIRNDKGYKPNDLLKPFPFNYIYVARDLYKNKKSFKGKPRKNDSFDHIGWSASFIDDILSQKHIPVINLKEAQNAFKTKEYSKYLLKYSYLLSASTFCSGLE